MLRRYPTLFEKFSVLIEISRKLLQDVYTSKEIDQLQSLTTTTTTEKFKNLQMKWENFLLK